MFFTTSKKYALIYSPGVSQMQKMHLKLTPPFYFAAEHRNFCLLCRQKTQISRDKKAYRRLFAQGLSRDAAAP
ncbi:MAG: hypothetical protein IJW40_12100 [Clostridia bacterium]|nr:hypothetical protein [Clostridia bacterium]MBQ7339177.1 hypothetical protein [Clostridia bacterium]